MKCHVVILLQAILSISYSATIQDETNKIPSKKYIINGKKSNPGQFPHHATLITPAFIAGQMDYQPQCGATVISDQWLVTAAHCTMEMGRMDRAVIGSHDIESATTLVTEIDEVIRHEYFNMYPVSHDIALLRTRRKIVYSPAIKPALLPEQDTEPTGPAIVSGHGTTVPMEVVTSNHLLYLDIEIVDPRKCLPFFKSPMPTIFFADQMLCGMSKSTESPCNGDSGGPIVQQNKNGNYTLVGVVSFGPAECGKPDHPYAMTKVSFFRDWIKDKTGI